MFDPYHKWLGIPTDQRPPTYYQLLGIARDEADAEVIASAALRQIAFVRNFQTGPHAEECARVLGELAQARLTLSNPEKRAAYDASLAPQAAQDDPGEEAAPEAVGSVFSQVVGSSADADEPEEHGFSPLRGVLQLLPHLLITGTTLVAAWYIIKWKEKHRPAPEPVVVTSQPGQAPAAKPLPRPKSKTSAFVTGKLSPPDAHFEPKPRVGAIKTLSTGQYVFEFPTDGQSPLEIQASYPGYRTQTKTFTLNPGETATWDFQLAPESPPSSAGPNEATAKPADPPARPKIVLAEGEVRRYQANAQVHSVAVSPDGRLAVAACGDGMLKTFDVSTGAKGPWFPAHEGPVLSVATWSQGDRSLALTGGEDKVVRVWDLRTGTRLNELEGGATAVTRAWFAPDVSSVVASERKEVWNWSAASLKPRATKPFDTERSDLAVSGDGRVIASCGEKTTVILNQKDLKPRQFLEHEAPVSAIALSGDGRRLLTGDTKGTLQLWDLTKGARPQEVRRFEGHKGRIHTVAFDAKGRRAVSSGGRDDPAIHVWDVETGKEVHRFPGHVNTVTRVVFVPESRSVLSGSIDKTVRLWEIPE